MDCPEPPTGRKGAGQALLSLQQRQEQVPLPPKKCVLAGLTLGTSMDAGEDRTPATPTQQSYYSKKVSGVGTGEGVSWVTVALTLGAETGTVNSWASAVPTRGVGTGAGEDQSTAALGARTGNSQALATLTRGTGTGAGGGWTAAALGTGPGAQGELLAVLKSASCFPHTD